MPHLNQNSQEFLREKGLTQQANGFILLEMLVAMSLVMTSWIALENTFQHMILRLGQLQEKRVQMKLELDQYELSLFTNRQESKDSHRLKKGFK
jgi:type II secretory pathway pseudopilin PulG